MAQLIAIKKAPGNLISRPRTVVSQQRGPQVVRSA
jgi:hypothetical protein